MNIWHDIDPNEITPEEFTVVIEIPKNSQCKYELDKKTGLIKLDRVLYTSTHYPANYGFIPRTYADDNDPLDVLVLFSPEIYPLTLCKVRPIGVVRMVDGGDIDDKIIGVSFMKLCISSRYTSNSKTRRQQLSPSMIRTRLLKLSPKQLRTIKLNSLKTHKFKYQWVCPLVFIY